MKRAILAGFLAVVPLSVEAQPTLNLESINDPAVRAAEAWRDLLKTEREERERKAPPPVCLKPNGTPEPCEYRQPRPPTTPPALPAPAPAPTTQAPPPRLTPRNSAWIPPAEYDGKFKGKLTEIRVTAELMRAMCPKTTFPLTLGCSFNPVRENQCVVIILEDKELEKTGWTAEMIRRHELGHCASWPYDHPGMRGATREETGWPPQSTSKRD
jgi:hypothetical protein